MPDETAERAKVAQHLMLEKNERDREQLIDQFYDYADMYPDGFEAKRLQQMREDEARIRAIVNAHESMQLGQNEQQLARGGAQAARDALHDNGKDQSTRSYTTGEARDRAAHAPSVNHSEPEK